MYHRELILEPRDRKVAGTWLFIWIAFDRAKVNGEVTKDQLMFVAPNKVAAAPLAEEHCRRHRIKYRFKTQLILEGHPFDDSCGMIQ